MGRCFPGGRNRPRSLSVIVDDDLFFHRRINDERPTGKKHTTVGWDDGGKIGKIIN